MAYFKIALLQIPFCSTDTDQIYLTRERKLVTISRKIAYASHVQRLGETG